MLCICSYHKYIIVIYLHLYCISTAVGQGTREDKVLDGTECSRRHTTIHIWARNIRRPKNNLGSKQKKFGPGCYPPCWVRYIVYFTSDVTDFPSCFGYFCIIFQNYQNVQLADIHYFLYVLKCDRWLTVRGFLQQTMSQKTRPLSRRNLLARNQLGTRPNLVLRLKTRWTMAWSSWRLLTSIGWWPTRRSCLSSSTRPGE